MEEFLPILQKSLLFQLLTPLEIKEIINEVRTKVVSYQTDAVIAGEGENCDSLGILLKGKIEIQKIYSSGKTVTIAQFHEGNIFGEAIIFSKHHLYPGTIISRTPAKILFLHKATVISLCQKYPLILESFMQLLSERILMLNHKIKELSLGTIRQKISHFLLEEYKKQNKQTIKLPFSKEILAEHMGIQRPSLSRELINMREEGLIDFQKNYITINNLKKLEESLQE